MLCTLWAAVPCSAENEMLQPRRLIDAHTAGVLPRASYELEGRIYPSGSRRIHGAGLLMGIGVGITHRLNVGISYGADGLVGRGRDIRPNPYPGGLIKYRLFEENYVSPGVAIGYEHQGYGGIESNDYRGYVYKSQGFFVALSKNFLLFSKVQFGIHGGVNFSFEEIVSDSGGGVRWPNGYLGIDVGLNEELAIAAEYDLALNGRDLPGSYDPRDYLNPLYGYLNLGVRYAFSESFYLEFAAKDVLERKVSGARILGWSRELKFVYVDTF
jgi:hypothetical protein